MSWLQLPKDSAFGLESLPYGVFSTPDRSPSIGVRIGDRVLSLVGLARSDQDADVWSSPSLNAFMALGPAAWQDARAWIIEMLTDPSYEEEVRRHLHALSDATMHLPIEIADYVDFYANEHHATNVGHIFRPGSEPLSKNWKHLPIGYHGRAGTVVVSGTDITRPSGQRRRDGEDPSYGLCEHLDIEAELGFVVGTPSEWTSQVDVASAREHIFGVVILNDWSARDLQKWESVPLGPFLGKSFATSISAWVLPLEALEPARVTVPAQDPTPLPYLQGSAEELFSYDLQFEVRINGTLISSPAYASTYWSPAQMLAHMTVNGASLRVGDLFASGTISGPDKADRGCLLEFTWGGTEPFSLDDGSTRTYLQDGDVAQITAYAAAASGSRIGLGEVVGRVTPAR